MPSLLPLTGRTSRAALAGLVVGVAVLATACGGSGTPATAPTTPATTSPPSAPPTTAAPPSSTPTPTATASASPSGRPASAPACAPGSLAVRVRADGAAAGTTYSTIVLRNLGATACSLSGYGAVTYADSSGAVVGAPASEAAGTPATVIVPAGGRAGARLGEAEAYNFPQPKCDLVSVDGLSVVPPGQRNGIFVHHPTMACSKPSVHLLTLRAYRLLG